MKKLRKSIAVLVVCCMLGTILAPQTADAASKKPTKMTLNVSKKTIDVGGTCKIQVKSVTPKKASKSVSYKTSDKKIATVSKSGVVSGKKEGTAKITVTSQKNKKLKKTVKITVKRLRPYSLMLSEEEKDLIVGDVYQLKATVKAVSPIVWSSGDETVATVDKDGKITAKADGSTIITVKTTKKSYNGKVLNKTCKVNISHTHQYSITKVVEPTCTESGYQENTCNICKDKQIKDIPATGHDYKIIDSKVPTCEEDGYTLYQCSMCNDTKQDTIEKLNHNYQCVKTVEPTCEEDGYKEYICQNCGEYKNTTIEKLGHDYKKIEHKDATCQEKGYDLYKCNNCGETKKEELALIEHHFERVKSNPQYIYYKCSICKEEKKEYNDKEYSIDLGGGKTDMIIGHYDLEMPKEVFELCNQKRDLWERYHLELVNADTRLQRYANIRAKEISYKYSHYRPNGEYVLDSKDFVGIDAENITPAEDAKDACKGWFGSPQHNETIVSNRYQSIAIATFCRKKSNGTYTHHFVQLFSSGEAAWWNENL